MPNPRKIMNVAVMKSLMTIGSAVLLSATVAVAQQPAPAGACAADIQAKCAGIQPGEGGIRACVKTHLAEFSEPCQARLATVASVAKACAADVKQSCTGMERRRSRIQTCIRGVLGNISDGCKEALAQAVAGRR
jgi:hypothetical protein